MGSYVPRHVNVLFLTSSYPTEEDPVAGVFVREHARAAAAHARIAIVHLDRGGGSYRIEAVPDADFHVLRVRYPRSPLAYPLHFLGAAVAFRRLRRSGFDPDVIHAHFFLAALPPLLLRPLFRRPVVVSEQWSVFLPEDPASLSPVMLWAARHALAKAARVMPASEALMRGMQALGVRARFEVVPNVVDTALFHSEPRPRRERRRLLFVGLLYGAKGVDILVRAFALLAARREDVELEIVGDGPDRAACEELAAALGVSHLVTFSGLQPKTEVAQRMREADVFALASRYDNNPCVAIEALASGLPIVATRVGGIPELVDDNNGLLAEPDDPEALAARMDEALDSLERFDRPAIAATATRRFGTEAVGAALRDIYVSAQTHPS
jgi:glycosyltransferase involved in cell wall biosynthesis